MRKRPDPAAMTARAIRTPRLGLAVITLGRFTLLEALRSRLALTAVIVICAGLGIGRFATELALTDGAAIRTLSMAWMFRVAAVFLVAGFTISSVVRDHNDRGMELLLALPMPRAGYLLGKFAGCAAAACGLSALFALPLLFEAQPLGVAAWSVSLALELVLIASASLLCALGFSHLVGSLAAVAAFYTLSRSIGAILAIGSSAFAPVDSVAFNFAALTLRAIAAILPRLDLFCRSQWLLDGMASAPEFGGVLLQAIIGSALLLAAALIDLARKSV